MRKPLRFTVAVVGIIGVLAAVGCRREQSAEAKADAPKAGPAVSAEKPKVKFAKVQSKTQTPVLDVSGTLVADETSEVATQVPGVVAKVLVDVGSRVKKGDPLVILDAREAQLRAASANAAVEQARARLASERGKKIEVENMPEVRAAKQAKELAEADFARAQKLHDEKALSQADFEALQTRAETSRAQYDQALAGARMAFAALDAANAQAGLAGKSLADATIRAPFDGAVTEKKISLGEYAGPGRAVMVVVRDNPVRLQIDVPELDSAHIELGKSVTIRVAAYPDRVFSGTVKRIGASLRANTRTLPVEAEIPNDDGALKPGFFAQGELSLKGATQNMIMVPEAAVTSSGTNSRVFVRSGTKVTERLVKVGRRSDGFIEVTGPIAVTDEVAVEAVDKLSDGAEVAL